jgi:MFS family permease
VFAFNFQVVFPLFVIQDLAGSASSFTLLYSVVSLGAFIGALAVARRAGSTVRLVAVSALAFGVSMALLGIAPNQPVAFVVGPLIGISSISFMTASTALVQTVAAPEMRGRVLALQAIVFLGSTPLGGPLVGWVAERFGARWAIAIGAVACLGAGAWGLRLSARAGEVAGRGELAGALSSEPRAVVVAGPAGTGEQMRGSRGWSRRRRIDMVDSR